MFNIFLWDFFVEYGSYYFTNYGDNTKIYIYIADENTNKICTNISKNNIYNHWLTVKRKQTMVNIICFWVLKRICIQIEYFTVKYCKAKTLLGININSKLKFHVRVGKLNALAKTKYMELPKNRILMNGFLTIQFNYYPAI